MTNQTALSTLEKIADEISTEHRNHVCNHYGACEYVVPFVQYMKENHDDAEALEEWADGNYNDLYDRIFDGNFRIDKTPETHVSNVVRFKEFCQKYGIEE